MPNLRRFLSRRRLLAFLGVAAMLFGVAMLHPYPRQSLFGPTIRGKPWCVWEAEVRRFVHREEYEKTVAAKTLRWLGISFEEMCTDDLFNDVEMFPLLLALTDDSDRDVRLFALIALRVHNHLHDPVAIPVLRRRLDDGDSSCRINAATAIWLIDRTEPVLDVLLGEIENRQNSKRLHAIHHLGLWSKKDPELFPHLVRYAEHPDAEVRKETMLCMQLQGDKAVPVLIKGMDDPSVSVRRMAINSLSILDSVTKEAVPGLLRRLNDEDKVVRARAAQAIMAIDPDCYARLKAERKIE